MAKLLNEIKASVELSDGDAVFTLRKPTNEELNNFLAKRYEVSRKGKDVRDNSLQSRVELFDQLLVKVENLEDGNGQPITTADKAQIPANWKADIIFKSFEDNEITIKN